MVLPAGTVDVVDACVLVPVAVCFLAPLALVAGLLCAGGLPALSSRLLRPALRALLSASRRGRDGGVLPAPRVRHLDQGSGVCGTWRAHL